MTSLSRLDRAQAQPLYEQIKHRIMQLIEQGDWQAGERIPSENDLVGRLGVSRMTIHRALRELTREGILNRVHGLGTFVAETPRHASLIQLQDIRDEVEASGSRYAMRVLKLESCAASRNVAERMELPAGSRIFELRAIHSRDEVPVQYEHRYVNPVLAPGFMEFDARQTTATRYLISLFSPDEMEHVVQAVQPSAQVARYLKITRAEPCLKLSRRTWKQGQVVTSVDLLYPGSRYDLAQRYATDDIQIR